MGKHKKTSERVTRKANDSLSSALPAPKSYKWLLVFSLIVCVVIAAFWGVKSFLLSQRKPQKEEAPAILDEQSRSSTSSLKRTAEQEIAALKQEELELGERILSEFPDTELSLLLIGNVYRKHGKSTEAQEYWKKALELNPERPDAYNGMGWIAFEKGEYEKAISFWRKALEIDPNMPVVHNSIAQTLIILGRYSEVIKEAEEELKISPRSGLSNFLLGQGHLKQKDYDKAKQYYEKAIEIQPDYMNAYYGLFTACSRLKLQEEAERHLATFKKLKAKERHILMDRNKAFDDIITIRKMMAETYSDAEKIYHQKGNIQEAEKLLRRAAALDPNSTKYLMKLGALFQNSRRLPDALKIYEKVAEIEPDNMISHINIGVISMQLKRFDNAEKVFKKVIKLAPKFSGGYRELAQLYLRQATKFPEALDLAKTAVELEETAANYFILSWAYDKNGDTANACSALKRATELDPTNLKYRQMYELIQKRDLRGDF
jgi:tetratricopeptide (TPR) repeat protein